MSSMTSLRDISNGDPVDAADPQFNFQTIENFIDSDVVTVDGSKGFTGAVSGVTATDPTHLAGSLKHSGECDCPVLNGAIGHQVVSS